ncbi:MAG: hypothetical protein TREMPRED_002981 [Tremellales sp. Tagirdzhanova-0007]|nr:MAG: hypothetical protein TREMPRED_002981 [Tremellales sp. Tagirdzhanova-0007]
MSSKVRMTKRLTLFWTLACDVSINSKLVQLQLVPLDRPLNQAASVPIPTPPDASSLRPNEPHAGQNELEPAEKDGEGENDEGVDADVIKKRRRNYLHAPVGTFAYPPSLPLPAFAAHAYNLQPYGIAWPSDTALRSNSASFLATGSTGAIPVVFNQAEQVKKGDGTFTSRTSLRGELTKASKLNFDWVIKLKPKGQKGTSGALWSEAVETKEAQTKAIRRKAWTRTEPPMMTTK